MRKILVYMMAGLMVLGSFTVPCKAETIETAEGYLFNNSDTVYWMIFDPNGGKTSASNMAYEVEAGDSWSTTTGPHDPFRAGYTFTGWYTEKKGGELVLNVEGTGGKVPKKTAELVTVYAHWKKKPTPKPSKPVIASVTRKNATAVRLSITCKTNTDYLRGYQVQFATNKSMKSADSKYANTFADELRIPVTITKGKTWYFRVRAYTIDESNDKKVYGKWSTIKSFKN